MKTIGYVLADFPALSETFIGTEIRAMRAHGHCVVPIVMHRLEGPAQPEDILLADEASSPSEVGLGSAVSQALQPARTVLQALAFVVRQRRLDRSSLAVNGLKIAAIARAAGCTHLHAHFAGGAAAHAIVAARWIGATVSFVGHGHDVYSEPQDIVAKLGAADFVIGTCDDLVSDLRCLRDGASAHRIPCGTDPSRFRPANSNPETGRFLAIGRLVEQKGYDDLLQALALLPTSIAVDIVGDGPLKAELSAAAARLGLGANRIRWLGARPLSWIARSGRNCCALVAPFKMAPNGERDTGPVVIKEAMAMGLPVIGTRFMGSKEMITSESGMLVEPGDVVGLADAMRQVAGMAPETRRAMGLAGRRLLEREFTLATQAARLSSLIEAA